MGAILMMIVDVGPNHARELSLVDGDHMTKTVAPEATYPPLGERILPRRPECSLHLFQSKSIHPVFEAGTVDLVIVAEVLPSSACSVSPCSPTPPCRA